MAKALEIKVSGVDEAIRMLERYQKTFQTRVELFMKKLTDYGVEKATEEVLTMDAVFTGELVNSIHSTEIENNAERVIFAVEADSEHAIFVEMGTGIIGATTPYPGKLPAMAGIIWAEMESGTSQKVCHQDHSCIMPQRK